MNTVKLCTAILAMFFILTGTAFGGSKAVFVKSRYNAGAISQGTVIQHDFLVKNTGNEPLTLHTGDCGCGGVKVKLPDSIKPGKSDVIKVSIPTKYLKGEFKRDLMIETNDPNNNEVIITITANINEVLSIMPQYIDFGRNTTGSKISREIIITNTGRDKITILGVKVNPSNAGSISPALGKTILKPNEKKKLEINLAPRNKPGYFQGQIIISTDIKNLEEKIIFFGAQITAN